MNGTTTNAKLVSSVLVLVGVQALACGFLDLEGRDTIDLELGGERDRPEAVQSERDLCEGLALSTASARPFEQVRLRQPEHDELVPYVVEARFEGSEAVAALVVRADEAGQLHVVAPVAPKAFEGGRASLRLRHSEGSCASTWTLEIEALEPAPGTSARLAGLLEDLVEAQLAQFGLERASLRSADPATLPLNVLPLLVADAHLREDNPNSVAKIVAGEAADVELEPQGLALLDALLAAAAVPERLERTIAALDSVARPGDQAWGAPAQHVGLQLRGARVMVPPILDIRTVEGLSAAMRHAHAMEKAYLDNRTTEMMGYALTALSLVPTGVTQVAGALGGLALSIVSSSAEACANLMPRALIEPEVETFAPTRFEEDSEAVGSWSGFTVYAKSRPWDATKTVSKLMIDALMTGKSVDGAAGLKDPSGLREALELHKAFRGNVVDAVAQDLSKRSLDTADLDHDRLSFPAYTWGPFDISDAQWSDAEVSESSPVQHRGDHRAFFPRFTGKGAYTLVSRVDKFPPGRTRFEQEVEVKAIFVDVEPQIGAVEVGQSLELSARVKYAIDDLIEWKLVSGPARLLRADERTATIVVDDDARDGELIVIKARSLADTGLRAPGKKTEEREGYSVLRVQAGIEILPATACVKPGASMEFEADFYTSDPDAELRWSVSAGAISAYGLFRAPASEGTVIVRAESSRDPEVFDEAEVRIGECACFYSAQTSGAHYANFSGVRLPNATYANANLSVVFAHAFGPDAKASVAIIVPEYHGELGTFPAMVKVGTEGQGRTDVDRIMAVDAHATITSFDGVHLEGVVHSKGYFTTDIVKAGVTPAPSIGLRLAFKVYVHNANDLDRPVDVLGGLLHHCLD